MSLLSLLFILSKYIHTYIKEWEVLESSEWNAPGECEPRVTFTS